MKYSLVQVWREHDGLIDGAWLQNCVGTLADAYNRAKETEAANGGKIKVAVVDELLGVSSISDPLTNLKPIITSNQKPYLVTITEQLRKSVVVYAEDNYEAEEITEELCNEDKVELDYVAFLGRDVKSVKALENELPKTINTYQQFSRRNI